MNTNQDNTTALPLRRNLVLIYATSIIVTILMAVMSVAGLLFPTDVYPDDDLLRSFVPNDVTTLLIGLPMLIGSMWAVKYGKLLGLLLWPGALLFVVYNYLIYVFAMPFSVAFLMHLTLVMLSVYTLIGLMAIIDGRTVRQKLAGAIPERLSGGVLAVLGLLFSVRAGAVMAGALASQASIAGTELALNTTDFLIAPTWIIGGVLLWRREALGYAAGLGLLFQASMLFVGLIVFLLIQPIISNTPIAFVDFAVVFLMGLVCFVPFGLYIRGVVSRGNLS